MGLPENAGGYLKNGHSFFQVASGIFGYMEITG